MIKQISFEEILPIWIYHLWDGRETEIKPTNGLKFLGGYDKSIENNTPTFFGAFINDECVGVNSGHATNDYEYRSRGIYVMPEYRRQGISQELFKATEDQCKKENKKILWSMPRILSLQAYEKFGFSIVSDFFDDMEFGPNCFVVKILGV
jgi:GNAT superfamily N-acetyltransferase